MSGTIIDAFLVTLGLDTKEFHTGVEQSKNDQDELRRNTEENAGKMKESYQGLIEKVGQLFALLAGGHELKEFFNSTQEQEVATLRLSDMIGMSVEKLGQWQGALIVNGGSAEGFNSSMKQLGGSLVDIEHHLPRAERALKAFQAAGIHLQMGQKADVLSIMDQIQGKMKTMSLMEGRELGRRMGLDEDFTRMLHDADGSLRDLMKTVEDIGTPTREEAEAMEQLERAQKTLGLTQGALGRIIVEMLAPAIKYVTDKMVELAKWANEHPAVIKTAFIGIAAAVSVLGIAAGIAMIPMLGITATLSGIALAVGMIASGLYMLWQQNDSWLHDLVDWVKGVGLWFEIVWDRIGSTVLIVLLALWENIKNIGAVVADVLGLVVALFSMNGERISKAWNKLCGDVNQMFKLMWNGIVFEASLAFFVMEEGAKRLWANMKAPAEAFFNWIASKFTWLSGIMGVIGLFKTGPKDVGSADQPSKSTPAGQAADLSGTSFRAPAAPAVIHQALRAIASHSSEGAALQPAAPPAPSPVLAMAPEKQAEANHLAAVAGLPPEVPAKAPAASPQAKLMDPTSKEALAFNNQFSFMGATAPHASMAVPTTASGSGGKVDNSKKEVNVGAVNIYPPSGDPATMAAGMPGAIRSTGLADQVDGGF